MSDVIVNHPILGELVYEDLLKGYVGSIELSGMPLKINLVTSDSNIEFLGNKLINFLESEIFEDVFIEGLEKLLEIKNKDWLNDDEAAYTLEEFCDFVSLDAIVMYVDKVELYTDDLELLWRNRAILKYGADYQLLDVEIDMSSTE